MKNKTPFPYIIAAAILFAAFQPAGISAQTPSTEVEFERFNYSITFLEKGTTVEEYPSAPHAHVSLSYLHPAAYRNKKSLTALQERIRDLYFSSPGSENIAAMLETKAREFGALWRETDFPETGEANSYSVPWELESSVGIAFNELDIVSAALHEYSFQGGAHGYGYSRYVTMDMRTGKEITLQDIFSGDFHSALSHALTHKLAEQWGADPDDLTSAGFFEPEVEPTDNFFPTPRGISFEYNPYDIAPYAMGSISIDIPYSEIGVLLDSRSPVARLWKR